MFTFYCIRRVAYAALALLFPFCMLAQPKSRPENIASGKAPAPGKGYLITGVLKNAANEKVYLVSVDVHKKDEGSDSTVADKHGRFSFAGTVLEPYVYRIKIRQQGIDFYLGNNRIFITGNADSCWYSKLSGSAEEDIRKEYNKDVWLSKELRNEYTLCANAMKEATSKPDSLLAGQKMSGFYKDLDSMIMRKMDKYPLAAASVDEISYFIDNHSTDSSYRMADSLLKRFESSRIGYYTSVKFMRNRIDGLRQLIAGREAPGFFQTDTAGKTTLLSSFRGKYTLLCFWASWCHPCRQENPGLVKIYNEYKKANFTIVSVSLDEKRADWLNAIRKDSLSWTQLSDLKGWRNDAAQKYFVNGIPVNYLIDPEGKIVAGSLTLEQLSEKLKDCMKIPANPKY